MNAVVIVRYRLLLCRWENPTLLRRHEFDVNCSSFRCHEVLDSEVDGSSNSAHATPRVATRTMQGVRNDEELPFLCKQAASRENNRTLVNGNMRRLYKFWSRGYGMHLVPFL